MASSFSWTSFFKSPTSSTLCFGDPTFPKLDQVKLLYETDFCITKSIPLCDPVVQTGTTFLLTSKTLAQKQKMYLQDKPSIKEATSILLTKVYKTLSLQKFGILHTSECLMVDVPCLDYLCDGQKDFSGDGQIKWHKWEISRNMPHCMLLGVLWQSCHAWNTHKIICRVVIMTDRPHYTWNYLSCVTESCTMDRHGETNLTKINRILSKDQILVSCSHMTCYMQKSHYISIYIFY